jgi:hypothetical protein
MMFRQVGEFGSIFGHLKSKDSAYWEFNSREFIFKQFMSTERRENTRCNEHKFVSRNSQFPYGV